MVKGIPGAFTLATACVVAEADGRVDAAPPAASPLPHATSQELVSRISRREVLRAEGRSIEGC